jgi:hypothetical protein
LAGYGREKFGSKFIRYLLIEREKRYFYLYIYIYIYKERKKERIRKRKSQCFFPGDPDGEIRAEAMVMEKSN